MTQEEERMVEDEIVKWVPAPLCVSDTAVEQLKPMIAYWMKRGGWVPE